MKKSRGIRVLETPSGAGNTWSQNIDIHTIPSAMTTGILLKLSADYATLRHYFEVQIEFFDYGE